MRLLVDVGNTRLKWALLEGPVLGDCRAQGYRAADLPQLLDVCWRDVPAPVQICVANVGGTQAAQAIAAYSARRWQLAPVFAEVKDAEAGVTNAYRDRAQLGIDRWLAVIAAWNKYRAPLLLVGCGTAVTIDAVDGGGRHLGGLIIPGLHLMQDCLRTGTSGIAAPAGAPALGLGDSTADCIARGAACAIISAIDRVSMDLQQQYGAHLQRLIMGGDAAAVNGLLMEPFMSAPNLVLEGLALSVPAVP